MSKKIKVALCQMNSNENLSDNIVQANKLIHKAKLTGAKLICLPEVWTCMSADPKQKLAAVEKFNNGVAQEFLASTAKKLKIYLSAGSMLIKGKSKPLNRSIFYGPDGKVIDYYDKIHLFRFQGRNHLYDEARIYQAGTKPKTINAKFAKIGLSICFDLRFPELYLKMKDPQIILVPAAFTDATGKAHWQSLLQARAIENQCFVLAAAQCGVYSNKLRSHGHSMIIDPWGRIIKSLKNKPGVISAIIDLAKIKDVRSRLPSVASRVLK